TFAEALRCGAEIFHSLKSALHAAGFSTSVGDEGGFAPDLKSAREALDFILRAVDSAGYTAGSDVLLAMDPAASEFFRDGRYEITGEGKSLTPIEMADYYVALAADYPIASIEDGMAEDDAEGWKALTDKIGNRVQLVGDDAFVPNVQRLQWGIDHGIANSILIKVNQVGTLTEPNVAVGQ